MKFALLIKFEELKKLILTAMCFAFSASVIC